MKKVFAFPLAAMLALGACNDVAPVAGPDSANFELVNGTRVTTVTHHVQLSYAIPFDIPVAGGGTTELVPQAILSGPGNFPGNPKNRGTCTDGLWYNSQNKPTSGSLENPHPHCTEYVEQGGTTTQRIYVELEPISVNYHIQNANNHQIRFTNQNGFNDAVKILNNDGELEGDGTIEAWAVLQEVTPAGTFPTRVGKITIDLEQFAGAWDDVICTVDADPFADGCIKQQVRFDYAPLPEADGGIGTAGTYTNGFLWWKQATSVYRAD